MFENKERKGHKTLCWEWSGNRAIRKGDWKLVWDKRQKKWELYDMSKDRTETQDLADTQPDRVKAMSAEWFDWAKKTGLKTKPVKKKKSA